jgi:phosphoenolpyruvate synthase/pyruvate phosphate dikinase
MFKTTTLGIGINVGSVTGEVYDLSKFAFTPESTKNKILIIRNFRFLRKLAFEYPIYSPSGVITELGGQLSHINSLFTGSDIKVALGIDPAFISSLGEKQVITIDNKDDDESIVYFGQIYLDDTSKNENIDLKLEKPLWISVWNSHQSSRFSQAGIAGIAVIKMELLLEYILISSKQEFDISIFESENIWEYIPKLFTLGSKFANKVNEELISIIESFGHRPVFIRLPDWQLPQDEFRGTKRLLNQKYSIFIDTILLLLSELQNKFSKVSVILPFIEEVEQYKNFKHILKKNGWGGKVHIMIEHPKNIVQAYNFLGLDFNGFIVGMSDLSSYYLNCSRELPINIFEHPQFNELISGLSDFIKLSTENNKSCIIGGLQTSWLSKIQKSLTYQPDGWFLRPDYNRFVNTQVI